LDIGVNIGSVDVGVACDRGKRRRRNEDRAIVSSWESYEGPAHFLAVADGMGGTPSGDVASQLAVEVAAERCASAGSSAPRELLLDIFSEANRRISTVAQTDKRYRGMGSTLVACVLRNGIAWVANVGDSRAYILRDRALHQITEDHSWVTEQLLAGQITKEEAAVSPRRNVITRSLGAGKDINTDTFGPIQLEGEDILLLCSDGLYNMLLPDEIAEIAYRAEPEQAVGLLVGAANDRGGSDNIAVIVARVRQNSEARDDQTRR